MIFAKHNTPRTVRTAFTLMEVMVVVAILVVLVGVAVPIYIKQLDASYEKRARLDIETLSNAAQLFYNDNGDYPPQINFLAQPLEAGKPPYIKAENLLDPWKQPYQYAWPPQQAANQTYKRPDVFTTVPGTNRMIGNWEPVK